MGVGALRKHIRDKKEKREEGRGCDQMGAEGLGKGSVKVQKAGGLILNVVWQLDKCLKGREVN